MVYSWKTFFLNFNVKYKLFDRTVKDFKWSVEDRLELFPTYVIPRNRASCHRCIIPWMHKSCRSTISNHGIWITCDVQCWLKVLVTIYSCPISAVLSLRFSTNDLQSGSEDGCRLKIHLGELAFSHIPIAKLCQQFWQHK